MPKIGVTAHMVVKNEDQWIWFAIHSVLPHVDQFLITDTGSSDNTIKIIESIKSDKIVFHKTIAQTAHEITLVRKEQIRETHTSWIWIVDGDEIYSQACANEVVQTIHKSQYDIILVQRYDLLGDVYHRQIESVGTYNLFGQSGHLLIRLINKDKVRGLHYEGDYPLEGFYDGQGKSILKYNPKKVYTSKKHLYHAMYLKRSSSGSNLSQMLNRSKYKVETGVRIIGSVPEVFQLSRPSYIPNPLIHRSFLYESLASIITPIKNLKRKLV